MIKLKLQSAIEYLTTYGWAILIIAIALVTLFELGVFNRTPPTTCLLTSGFGCNDYYMTTNGVLVFNLEQQTTNPINVTGIACFQNSTLLAGQQPYNPPSNQVFMPVGSSDVFYVQCYTSNTVPYSGNIGAVFPGTLAIYYTDAVTHFTELSKGTINVPVSTNEQILTQGSSDAINTVTITVTDTTSLAVQPNFQQMLSITPSNFASNGLNANMSNIEFTTGPYGSGVPIQAWIESGASNTATNAIIWLKLPSGITANGGTQTVYMNFMNNNAPVTSGVTGYAPQLWCASGCFQTGYAQYDNGASVFNNYWNFAGTSLPSGLTETVLSTPSGASGSYIVNNGFTLSNVDGIDFWVNDYMITLAYHTSTISLPQIIQAKITSLTGNAGDSGWTKFGILYQNDITDSSDFNGEIFAAVSSSNGYLIQWQCGGYVAPSCYSATGGTISYPNIISIVAQSSSSVGSFYGSNLGTLTQVGSYETPTGITSPGYIGVFITAHNSGGTSSGTLQYFLSRAYPPNGVMPRISCSYGTCTN